MSLFEPIFDALNARAVRYVLVGGLAVVFHGYTRLTIDVDLVVDLSPDEALKAVRALGEIGFRPRLPVEPEEFADPAARQVWISQRNLRVFSMFDPSDPLREVDLFVEEPMPFDELMERSVLIASGRTLVRVASVQDLIRMKRAAGRPRDLEDIAALEELSGDG